TAVLQKEPDWDQLPVETPPLVESLLRQCLERNPARRLRDMREAARDLEQASAESRSGRDATRHIVSRSRRIGLVAALGSVVVSLIAWWASHQLGHPTKLASVPSTNQISQTASNTSRA